MVAPRELPGSFLICLICPGKPTREKTKLNLVSPSVILFACVFLDGVDSKLDRKCSLRKFTLNHRAVSDVKNNGAYVHDDVTLVTKVNEFE
jgi:hypothetical protein